MKVSILGVGALLCLGIAVVQASLFTKTKSNSHLQMLHRAKRSFMKRGHEEDESCKLQCEDYGLIAYVYGVVANQLIHCYTFDLYDDYYTSGSDSSDSGSEEGEEGDGIYFFSHACDFMQEVGNSEMEAYSDPDYKPEIYTCSEYEYFLLIASCLSTYMNLDEYYYAQYHTGNHDPQDDLVYYLERDLLHECNDLFFGPYCLVMWLTDHPDKGNCTYYDLHKDFGEYYSEAEDFLCPSARVNIKKSSSTASARFSPKRKITKADADQIKAANVARESSKREQAKIFARSREFENLNQLKQLLQGLLGNNKN